MPRELLVPPTGVDVHRTHLGYPDDLSHESAVLREFGVPLVIPQRNIFGRQTLDEYSRSKTLSVDAEFKAHGPAFLERNPVVSCPLTLGEGLMIATLDGHHRSRRAPKWSIYNIPNLLLPIHIAAQIYKKDPAEFEDQLFQAVLETQQSFSRLMPDGKQPRIITARSVEELQAVFPSFTWEPSPSPSPVTFPSHPSD